MRAARPVRPSPGRRRGGRREGREDGAGPGPVPRCRWPVATTRALYLGPPPRPSSRWLRGSVGRRPDPASYARLACLRSGSASLFFGFPLATATCRGRAPAFYSLCTVLLPVPRCYVGARFCSSYGVAAGRGNSFLTASIRPLWLSFDPGEVPHAAPAAGECSAIAATRRRGSRSMAGAGGGRGAMVNDSPWRDISWYVRRRSKTTSRRPPRLPTLPLSELARPAGPGAATLDRLGWLSASHRRTRPRPPDTLPSTSETGPPSPPTWRAGGVATHVRGRGHSRAPSRSWPVTWTWWSSWDGAGWARGFPPASRTPPTLWDPPPGRTSCGFRRRLSSSVVSTLVP